MLIRPSGYNDGAQEYLESGVKSGREHSRDELDERVILDGDLDVTRAIYQSIKNNGQDRYLSFTMGFKEDEISYDTLLAVTLEFKQFITQGYREHELNFYAEAHLPKIKHIVDKKTGELIERKPHIHILVPRKNMLSGKEANPVGKYLTNEKYFEAIQEHLNQKYNLSSPRENIRFDPQSAASVLSRYKGDDFYGKNRDFKKNLIQAVVEGGINTRPDFYRLVESFGEIKIRNEGRDNEYVAVKLPGDEKFTNLKETIFHDDFIVRRDLKKPPLEKRIIQERLSAWPHRAREIKYVGKAGPGFRKTYRESSPETKALLLAQIEESFYRKYGDEYGSAKPTRNRERSPSEAEPQGPGGATDGLQVVPRRSVADRGQAEQTGSGPSSQLLPDHARVHLEPTGPGGNLGLRTSVRGGSPGSGGRRAAAGVPGTTEGRAGAPRRRVGSSGRHGGITPPYARNPYRVGTTADVDIYSQRLLPPRHSAYVSEPSRAGPEGSLPGTKKRRRSKGNIRKRDLPPYARSPHKVATSEDVERHSTKIFDVDLSGTPQSRRSTSASQSSRSLPPYARSKNRVSSTTDIEKHSQRLLGLFEFSGPIKPAPVISRAQPKPIRVNKTASNVAAYFNRQLASNQLSRAQRSAIKRLDQRFYQLKRVVVSDIRLTQQDKAQLVSVLIYERLKVRQSIEEQIDNQEDITMGSSQIRALMQEDETDKSPEFSISSGAMLGRALPIRERVKQFVTQIDKNVSEVEKEERERVLNAHDLYAKKARFSTNVHYLDKTTDKTIFVDTGKTIALRRTGLTESGVALALQMAQSRFGSTLKINGSDEFKKLVVEAAVKNNMDIHFTDKGMNARLAERRAEIELERTGGVIERPSELDKQTAQADPGAPAILTPVERAKEAGLNGHPMSDQIKVSKDELTAYVDGLTQRSVDFYKLQTETGIKLDPVVWAGLRSLQQSAEQAFTALKPQVASASPATPSADSRAVIRGVLLDHGRAPYQHDINKETSYYVAVKTPEGTRTLWGTGLEDAMADRAFQKGEPVVLEDLGTTPVIVPERQQDGSVKNVNAHRRAWSVEREGAESVQQTPSEKKVDDSPVASAVTRLRKFDLNLVEPNQVAEVTSAVNRIGALKPGDSKTAKAAAAKLANGHLEAFKSYIGTPAEMMMALTIKSGMDMNPHYQQSVKDNAPGDWHPIFEAAGLLASSVSQRETAQVDVTVPEKTVTVLEEERAID
jgi:hypothetical protein